jgi:predicted  nucleic acid-binding Zn-ribbon protein
MGLMTSLIHLHEVDLQVRGLRSRLDAARRYLDAQEVQLRALAQQSEEIEARRRHKKAAIANLEVEMLGIDERIEKLRDQLNSAATNKLYTALLGELTTLKENRGQVEERLLGEMESLEQSEGHSQQLAEQIAERRKVRDVAGAQLRERQAEIGERLSELESERSQAASSVPSEQLAVFEEMALMYDGEAMAHVEEVDRRHREYACGECHMTLPFEHVSLLLSGADQLVRCTACARILYLQSETRSTLAR